VGYLKIAQRRCALLLSWGPRRERPSIARLWACARKGGEQDVRLQPARQGEAGSSGSPVDFRAAERAGHGWPALGFRRVAGRGAAKAAWAGAGPKAAKRRISRSLRGALYFACFFGQAPDRRERSGTGSAQRCAARRVEGRMPGIKKRARRRRNPGVRGGAPATNYPAAKQRSLVPARVVPAPRSTDSGRVQQGIGRVSAVPVPQRENR